jgi:hypothetical protein
MQKLVKLSDLRRVNAGYLTSGGLGYMFGLLLLMINATASAVPISTIPFVYTTPIGGCVNFSAYLDPLSPWGIASVYAVRGDGTLTQPTLDKYPTPKYVRGYVCGDFLSIRIDRWRSVGPLVPITVRGEDSAYLYIGIPYDVNGTAIVKVKSFTRPLVTGQFIYRVVSAESFGVYAEEYIVYGVAQISGYGIVNITYISIGGDKPDYYVYVPTRGVKVEGVRPWTPDFRLLFAPNQTEVVGKPRVVVEQISVPVVGECSGVAYVVNPLERPLRIYVKLDTGEQYALSSYYLPMNITTWRFRGAVAKTVDGQSLPVYAVSTVDGSQVGMCVVEGASYYVYVKTNETVYRYPAQASGGFVEAYTDLVRPKATLPGFNVTVEPEVAKIGSNVTVRIYYNGTLVAEYIMRASPTLFINASSFFHKVKVVDVLGTPLPRFVIYVGGLKFYGVDGVAYVIPVDANTAVEVNGVRYLVRLQPEIRVPTLTKESFFKIVAASAVVGAAVAFGFRKKEKPTEESGRDIVEV